MGGRILGDEEKRGGRGGLKREKRCGGRGGDRGGKNGEREVIISLTTAKNDFK